MRGHAVVEVSAKLHQQETDDTDGDQHLRLRFRVAELIEGNPLVIARVERELDSGEDVFVEIAIADSMWISESIQGLVVEVGLNQKREWVPMESGQLHGSAPMLFIYSHTN